MKIIGSSNITNINYKAKKKILTVDFANGGKYEYAEVPPGIFTAFKLAVKEKESIGSLFSKLVKNSGFEAKKIK